MASPAQGSKEESRLSVVSATELRAEWWDGIVPSSGPKWLIEDLIPSGGLALLVGKENSGKSYLALDIGAHVAAGLPWFDSPTAEGLVIYVAAEDAPGLRCRIAALRDDREWPPGLPLALLPIDLDLTDARDFRKLVDALSEIADDHGERIRLIVIDTLSRTFGDRDENGSEMAAYVRSLGRIQSHFGAAVLVVHHPGKRGRSSRGHTSLPAACDMIAFVDAPPRGRIEVIKQRNGRKGRLLHFALRHHPAHDACVVQPQQALSAVQSWAGQKEEMGVMLEQLSSMAKTRGINPENLLPREVSEKLSEHAVLVDARDWEQASREKFDPKGRKPDSLRMAAARAKRKLIEQKLIGSWGNWVWPLA